MKKIIIISFMTLFMGTVSFADWSVDFSRRSKQLIEKDERGPASTANKQEEPGFFESIFEPTTPLQEVVIMNTDKGFIPTTVRVRQGMNYKVHLVNINDEDRNVSFVMDAFSEHHATYFGRIKTFVLSPKKEGVFTFQCPETSAQGKLVVYPSYNMNDIEMRSPASR